MKNIKKIAGNLRNKRLRLRSVVKTKWTIEMAEDIKTHYGIDCSEDLEKILVQELKKTIQGSG